MICPQCKSKLNNRAGVSKANNPYNGNFCSNKGCDYVEWLEAKPQVQSTDEIMGALRTIFEKLDTIENNINALGVPRTERLKQGEIEEPIRDEFENITNEDIANGDGKVPFPPMSDIPYETQRDDKGTGDDK